MDPARIVERASPDTHDLRRRSPFGPEARLTLPTDQKVPHAPVLERDRSALDSAPPHVDRGHRRGQAESESRSARRLAIRTVAGVGDQRILADLVASRATQTAAGLRKRHRHLVDPTADQPGIYREHRRPGPGEIEWITRVAGASYPAEPGGSRTSVPGSIDTLSRSRAGSTASRPYNRSRIFQKVTRSSPSCGPHASSSYASDLVVRGNKSPFFHRKVSVSRVVQLPNRSDR